MFSCISINHLICTPVPNNVNFNTSPQGKIDPKVLSENLGSLRMCETSLLFQQRRRRCRAPCCLPCDIAMATDRAV